MAIVHFRSNRDRSFYVGRNMKLVANQCGPACLDRVVKGYGTDCPHFVVIDELSLFCDRPVGEAMGPFIEHSIWLDESAVVYLFTGGILHDELGVRFIEIANFRDE